MFLIAIPTDSASEAISAVSSGVDARLGVPMPGPAFLAPTPFLAALAGHGEGVSLLVLDTPSRSALVAWRGTYAGDVLGMWGPFEAGQMDEWLLDVADLASRNLYTAKIVDRWRV